MLRSPALMFNKHGNPLDVLHCKQLQISNPGIPDAILVNYLAAPINPSDLNQITGVYPNQPRDGRLPAVGGNEGIARVISVPRDSLASTSSGSLIRPGDLVIPLRPHGSGLLQGISSSATTATTATTTAANSSGLQECMDGAWRQYAWLHPKDHALIRLNDWLSAEQLSSIPLELLASLKVNLSTAYRLVSLMKQTKTSWNGKMTELKESIHQNETRQHGNQNETRQQSNQNSMTRRKEPIRHITSSFSSNHWLIQNAATSAVGQLVIQLCHAWNIPNIAVIRDRSKTKNASVEEGTPETKEYLMKLGATVVLTEDELSEHISSRNSQTPSGRMSDADGIDLQQLIQQYSPCRHTIGQSTDIVASTPTQYNSTVLSIPTVDSSVILGLNAVSGSSAALLAKALSPGATLVTYGGMSKRPLTVGTSDLIFRSITCTGFWLTRWYERVLNDEQNRNVINPQYGDAINPQYGNAIAEMYSDLLTLIQQGKLSKIRCRMVDFADEQAVKDAIEYACSESIIGKEKVIFKMPTE